MRFRRSLRTKIFVAALLAALVPLLVAGWVVTWVTDAHFQSDTLQEARNIGELTRTILDGSGQRLLASAQAIALDSHIRDSVLARDRSETLAAVTKHLDRLQGATVLVVDSDARAIVRSYAPDQYGDNLGGSLKWLRRTLAGQPSYSTEVGGLRGLALRGFAPIEAEGRIVGAVVVSQAIDEEFLTSLRQATRYETFALLPDGTTTGRGLEPALAKAIREGGNSFSALAQANGREESVYAWKLADPDGEMVAFLGVMFPLDHQEGAQAHLRQTAIAALVLAALGSVLIAWLLSSFLLVPLERIAATARAIASGQEREIPPVGSGDELEDLSWSLTAMVAALSEQSRQLKALNERMAEFVNIVSHELRTPLTSVLAFAELLLVRQLTPEKTRLYVETILREATRLNNLVNDFLDIRRIESGRLALEHQSLDLVAIAQEVSQTLAVGAERHQISIVAPRDLPPAFADGDRVRQILTNLISNAIKYSPAGGPITVSFGSQDGAIRAAVRDEGLGIPSEAMGQLFSNFSRLDLADRRGISGTGLGLALCKDLVERHGGQIWVESMVGKGSTFFFTLPTAPQPPPSRQHAISGNGASGDRRWST